jgi:4-amino-4-deoxy-L-arabinose transferase-like glycosyltransferase
MDSNGDIKDARWRIALFAYALVDVIVWAVWPLVVNYRPSGDNYEQLRWAENLAWGYDKHPPLPTMVLWVTEQIFPTGIALTYALGGVQVAVMLAVVWWLTKKMLGERHALLAVLFVSCVTYYNNRLNHYNHNTALLFAYALCVMCTYQASTTKQWKWYALLGVTWAIGLLSKYQMVVAIACNGLFLLWTHRHQWPMLVGRLLLAGGVCTLLLVPHVLWLIDNQFPSFNYAAKFVAADVPWLQRPVDVISFLLDQLMRVAPVGALCLLLRYVPRKKEAVASTDEASPFAKAFLLAHAWLPLALMCALSVVAGTDLQMHWGTAFIWMTVIWLLSTRFGATLVQLPLRLCFYAIVALQCVMLLAFH